MQIGQLVQVKVRFQWPCGLRRRSAASRLLTLWVRIPPGYGNLSLVECCVLSGRGLCDRADSSSKGYVCVCACVRARAHMNVIRATNNHQQIKWINRNSSDEKKEEEKSNKHKSTPTLMIQKCWDFRCRRQLLMNWLKHCAISRKLEG